MVVAKAKRSLCAIKESGCSSSPREFLSISSRCELSFRLASCSLNFTCHSRLTTLPTVSPASCRAAVVLSRLKLWICWSVDLFVPRVLHPHMTCHDLLDILPSLHGPHRYKFPEEKTSSLQSYVRLQIDFQLPLVRQKQKWKKEYLRQVKGSLTQKPSIQQVPKFEILKFPK